MKRYKHAPNKNIFLIISILVIFITSIATYAIGNISFFSTETKNIVIILLGVINTFFGCFPLFYFFAIGGQNWVIKQFMVVLFNALFANRLERIKQKNDIDDLLNTTYRITYYKYYDKNSFMLKIISMIRNIRSNKYSKQRQISGGYNYLLCKFRYGIENGTYDTSKTTKPYAIFDNKEKLKGVTSLIYSNNKKTYLCIDNININSIIKKIKTKKNELNLFREDLFNETITKNIQEMKTLINNYNTLVDNNLNKDEKVSQDEQNELIKFMKQTHTDYNDIFNISGGIHSEHFLGFKIYDQRHNIIGVFTIDAKDPWSGKFDDIVFNNDLNQTNQTNTTSNEKWIENLLETFSGLNSKSIYDLTNKEDNNGKRIRD